MPGAGDPDNRRFMQWEGLTSAQAGLRTLVAKLGKIRRDHPALWRGARSTLSVTDDTYSYAMSDGVETLYVGLNRGDVTAAVGSMPQKGRDLLTDELVEGPGVTLAPRSARIIVVNAP